MKVLYDWLTEYCGEESMPGTKEVEEMLTFHAFEIDGTETVGGRTILDVKVLPDRAGDCLSHRGIAKEIAAISGKPLRKDPLREPVSLTPVTPKITVSIEDDTQCRRFAAALVTNVTVGESPDWLKARLEALGQRSINNVVDATNYVMLALGQPLHAYDAKKFSPVDGLWQFGVRMAKEGEEVTTLAGDTHTLSPDVQLITNKAGDVPVGIAGVKGGKSAEVDADTTDIILEAANFDPQNTRRTSQALKLQTDASKRFENNISPELVPYGLSEAVALITEMAGGACEGYIDAYPKPFHNTPVTLTLSRIHALLGLELAASTVEDIFDRLGFTYERSGEAWQVTAPFERTDILIPEDVIAEVGRVHGYEHIVSVIPEAVPLSEYNARHFYAEEARKVLAEDGFSEVITSSFREKDVVSLQNALASDKGCLRSQLASNLQEVLDKNIGNADLLGLSSIQVFEIGTVFTKTDDDVTEHVSLALGVRTKSAYTPKDDARLKEVVAKLEENLGVPLAGTLDKGVYECDFSDVIARLPMPSLYAPVPPASDAVFVPYSQYPYITRDVAVWVGEEITAEEVEASIRKEAGELLVRLTLFDEFKKEGRISYAFRLIFQSSERTLTDDEIQPIMTRIQGALTEMGGEVR